MFCVCVPFVYFRKPPRTVLSLGWSAELRPGSSTSSSVGADSNFGSPALAALDPPVAGPAARRPPRSPSTSHPRPLGPVTHYVSLLGSLFLSLSRSLAVRNLPGFFFVVFLNVFEKKNVKIISVISVTEEPAQIGKFRNKITKKDDLFHLNIPSQTG